MKALFLFLVFTASCTQYTFSNTMTESATVDDVVTSPAHHGTGTGISTSGNAVFSEIDIPEHYAVVFVCQHGRFMLQGNKENKVYPVWKTAKKGATVTVSYRERYIVEGNGTKHFDKFEFLNVY